ncbi:MAG: succinate dehydrogenase cytochrome b subunit [Actinomycetia bacterium]|nr:succinate dehydrogenase cytochrome b subunit [Actinomycetes bacterium]MCP3909667.1 succinate dehydrogenase cytochrome b subunit [Actinomycetes bacterium]
MPFPLDLYQTMVGKKWVMALTGVGLLGFVLVHMIGNLHLYEGPVEIHEYAEALRDLGGHIIPRTYLLWAMRLGLIAMFALHIHSAVSLSRASALSSGTARQKYQGGQDYVAVNFASRTMRWTGPIILLYILFHLADLTWGNRSDDWVRGDPYHNVVISMGNVGVAAIYILANVVLAVHIFHGVYSMFQSLGVNNPKINGIRRPLATGLAALILVGNLSFPLMVQFGLIDEDNCEAPCGLTGAAEAHAEEAAQ